MNTQTEQDIESRNFECPYCSKIIRLRKTPGKTSWNILQHLRKHKLGKKETIEEIE